MTEQQDFDFTAPPPSPPKAPPDDGEDDGERFYTRQQQMLARFIKFFWANPRVWELFQYYTLELIGKRFQHYSSDAVCQRIRWHTALETRDDEPYGGIKIGDHYRAYYARLFHLKYPQHDGFFRNKKLRSEDYGPFKHEPSPDGEPPGPELDLTEQLRRLL